MEFVDKLLITDLVILSIGKQLHFFWVNSPGREFLPYGRENVPDRIGKRILKRNSGLIILSITQYR
jgi:hypothetical protein